MKLLIVFPSMERGGAEGYALSIARAASQRSWQVEAASPPAEATKALVAEFHASGVPWRPVGIGRGAHLFGRRPRPLVFWFELFNSLRLLRRTGPDVVLIVLSGVAACFGVQIAAALLRIPAASCFQLTPREAWVPSSSRKGFAAWARGRGQAWISVSDDNADFVSQAFEMPREELHIISNGAPIHKPVMDRTEARAHILRELGLPPDAELLLSVARLGIQKAHAILLEAIPAIMERYPLAHFIWMGEGEQRGSLEQRIAELGVGGHVHLVGFRNNVRDWLSACDMFLLPTHYEGLPFSLVEALASGTPVVASAVSSIPDVLDKGNAGKLVPANMPELWRDAVCEMLEHAGERMRLAERGRARAELYSEAKMQMDTLALLKQLAQKAGKG